MKYVAQRKGQKQNGHPLIWPNIHDLKLEWMSQWTEIEIDGGNRDIEGDRDRKRHESREMEIEKIQR